MTLLTSTIRKIKNYEKNALAVHIFFISGLLVFLGVTLSVLRLSNLAAVVYYLAFFSGLLSFLLFVRSNNSNNNNNLSNR
jgi:hypothetical protein